MKSIRLALIGLDSSHADQLVRLVAGGQAGCVDLVALGLAVSQHGAMPSPERADVLAEEYRVVRDAGVGRSERLELFQGSPQDLAEQLGGEIDAVIIADRDGRAHADHAEPFLRQGIHTLVDKPFTHYVSEAQRLLAIAKDSGAILTSFSPLRWAPEVQRLSIRAQDMPGTKVICASGPVVHASPYGGSAFYAVHTIEMALELAGSSVLSSSVMTKNGAVHLSIEAESALISIALLEPGVTEQTPFHLSLLTGTGRIDAEVELGPDYLLPGLTIFLEALRTGRPPLANRALLDVVRILETCLGDAIVGR